MARRLLQYQWDAQRAAAKANAKAARLREPGDESLVAQADSPEEALLKEYAEMTNDELSAELKARELPYTGNKDELIARLQESDEE